MLTYILIMFIGTSPSAQAGVSAISQEFYSEQNCIKAGSALTKDATKRNRYVLTWGCFPK